MIVLEVLDDGCVHIPKLTAVTFIEDNDNVFVKNCVTFITADEIG